MSIVLSAPTQAKDQRYSELLLGSEKGFGEWSAIVKKEINGRQYQNISSNADLALKKKVPGLTLQSEIDFSLQIFGQINSFSV